MRRAIMALAAAIGGATITASAADGPDGGGLAIHATGFTHARGHAVAKLFVPGDNVLGPGRWQVKASIEGGAATFRIPALLPGRYAAVVFHDENDNAVIDHGLLGPS